MENRFPSAAKYATAWGVACGAGAALFWAFGFVAARQGVTSGLSPLVIALHRFMWPGLGADLHTEELSLGRTNLRFSETSVFRNGAPVASAQIRFKLTKASPNTYGGYIEASPASRVELGGLETGSVIRVRFPKNFPKQSTVEVCIVLKEPTLAIDFSAAISHSAGDDEECLRTIAKSIAVNAGLVGEKVFADVAQNQQTGELELYVTKPYLTNGMATLRFS